MFGLAAGDTFAWPFELLVGLSCCLKPLDVGLIALLALMYGLADTLLLSLGILSLTFFVCLKLLRNFNVDV